MDDESGNTSLHLAAISGSADSMKHLIENGADLLLDNKDKHTAFPMVLNSLTNMEDIMTEISNESIEVTKLNNGKEEFEVTMKVLRPKTRNRMAVVNRLYSHHRHNKSLPLHPLMKMLIRVEFKKSKQFFWYRSTRKVYLFYLLMLAVFVT